MLVKGLLPICSFVNFLQTVLIALIAFSSCLILFNANDLASLSVGGTKANVGHTEPAAGIVGMLKLIHGLACAFSIVMISSAAPSLLPPSDHEQSSGMTRSKRRSPSSPITPALFPITLARSPISLRTSSVRAACHATSRAPPPFKGP